MDEIRNRKNIDIRSMKWGFPPVALLPRSLRMACAGDVLPAWVCSELGLPENACFKQLDSGVWNVADVLSTRLKHFLEHSVQTRRNHIAILECFDQPWPAGLDINDVAWDTRTRNSLGRAGLLQHGSDLTQLTYGQLFDIHGMGVTSILDFTTTLEGAMDMYRRLAADYAQSIISSDPAELVSRLEAIVSEDWAGQISAQDPRFQGLMPASRGGTVQEQIERILGEPDASGSISAIPGLLQSIAKVEGKISELSELSLEESLSGLLAAIMRTRGTNAELRREALMARLGWAGEESATLRHCSEMLGVSRERVRQLQKKVEASIPEHEVFMPALDAALKALSEAAPVSFDTAAGILMEHGISRVTFHPKSVLGVADLLSKPHALSVIDDSSGRVIVSDNDVLMAQAAMRLARKLSGRSGAVSTFQLQDALAAAGHEIDEETAREVLTGGRQFEAFGDDWFRATDIPSERDRLRNVVRKMLSVVSPQSLLSIREGLRRAYRGRAGSAEYPMMPIVPPLTVISAILAAHPEFEVWGEEVHSVVPLDSARELGDTERVFVEVLRSSPAGVLDRRSLAEGCISRGVNENTFSVYTTYSSILDHVDLDVWKLRGVKVDPASVEAVRQFNRARPRQKRVLGHGWTPDGKLWLAARVPRLEREHLVIGCPAAILRFLAGQTFSCQAKGSPQPCGSISVNEQGTSHGYGVFIRRMGIDENDIFLAEFDVAAKTVVLSVGDEELLDEEA